MEEKIKLLQEMASSESDIRDGNIGSFSQGVVVGERNASRLALEIIESIKSNDKQPYMTKVGDTYIPTPIYESGLKELNVDFSSKVYDNGDYGNIKKIEIPKSFSWKPDSTKSMG